MSQYENFIENLWDDAGETQLNADAGKNPAFNPQDIINRIISNLFRRTGGPGANPVAILEDRLFDAWDDIPVIPPPAVTGFFLLLESGDFLLLESGGKIILN
jgi:hypothetical protein